MPNWCENRVSFSGPEADLKKLKSLMGTEDQVISFQKIKPMPEGLDIACGSAHLGYEALYDGDIDRYGHRDWYSWRVAHWGTKWDIDANAIQILVDSPDYLSLAFDTAWSPPQGIYDALGQIVAEQELDIHISWFYDEPGMQFAGYLN